MTSVTAKLGYNQSVAGGTNIIIITTLHCVGLTSYSHMSHAVLLLLCRVRQAWTAEVLAKPVQVAVTG